MTSQGEPVSLGVLLDQVQQRLPVAAPDGFLFSGNPHETVPRALFLDERLTPLERNAWQVIKLQLNKDGLTALSTYEQLRPFLASMPCGAKASLETVARALTVLRLTRWLSLVRRRRDSKTGRIQGNLYVLHDEPLTPWEAMQLDAEYLSLVSRALGHASKSVQRVGCQVLHEVTQDPLLRGHSLPTRIQVLVRRMAESGWRVGKEEGTAATDGTLMPEESYPQPLTHHESEGGQDALLRNSVAPVSESEAGQKAPKNGLLRNPKDSTVRSSSIYKIRTTEPHTHDSLCLPQRFVRLKDVQQSGAWVGLQQLAPEMQQAVLDEWDVRCQSSTVRNQAAYLFGIIQKAIHGEFNAVATQGQSMSAPLTVPPATAPPAADPPASPEVALRHLAKLQDLLRGR
jgi:hypothetical protein